jgi:hypothetical protein
MLYGKKGSIRPYGSAGPGWMSEDGWAMDSLHDGKGPLVKEEIVMAIGVTVKPFDSVGFIMDWEGGDLKEDRDVFVKPEGVPFREFAAVIYKVWDAKGFPPPAGFACWMDALDGDKGGDNK